MPIEIEINSSGERNQEEHIHFFAYCNSCPFVSEENGDYGPPPLELSWVRENSTLDEVVAECSKHEQEDDKVHDMRIVGIVHSPHTDKRLE